MLSSARRVLGAKRNVVTAVCIMIDRSQKLVEWDFSFPMTGFYGFDKGVNDDE